MDPEQQYQSPNRFHRLLPRMALALALSAVPLIVSYPSHMLASNAKLPPIHTVDGAQIFQGYCASCHGADGTGGGPAAPALKHKVPDLTQISKRSGNRFPRARIHDVIDGTETAAAHGSREMPIWGPIFHQIGADQDLGNVRTENVIRYLESIQRK
jgi:mono/diheme cytochrome c family protein